MEQTLELRPARISERFVAYLLDTVPFTVAAAASVWAWAGVLRRPPTDRVLLVLVAAWTGAAVLWQFAGNLAGGTPGKRIMGLAVVRADGSRPGALGALVRALVWLIGTPLFNFGFAVALVHPRSRALHDLAAGTFVVEAGPRRSNGAAAFLLALAAAAGLVVVQGVLGYLRPTPADLAAEGKAREGLEVIARVEAACLARNGTYAASLDDLAQASGDPATFRAAMGALFAPSPFLVEGGNRRWRVTVAAKDRRRTVIVREGP